MEVLGIGPLELMVIGVIALLVIKPEDWGKTGRTLAKWINQVTSSDAWRAMNESWRAASEFSTELRREMNLEKSLRELDEFGRPAYRRNPGPTDNLASPSTLEAGEAETNVIQPPRSAPFVTAPAIQPAQKKSAARVKRKPAKAPAKKSKSLTQLKRKPKKTHA